MSIPDHVKSIVNKQNFMTIATCSSDMKPSAAYKFLLECKGNCLYFIDFARARTWNNLKKNNKASVAVLDSNSLTDYQLNGTVELLSSGVEYRAMLKNLSEKRIDFTVCRIIEGVREGKQHAALDIITTEKIIVLKLTVEESVTLGPAAELAITKRGKL